MSSLTNGAVLALVNETQEAAVFHPTMQILDIKKIGGSANGTGGDRYRVIISDGRHFAQSMVTTQLNELIETDRLKKFAIVKLTEYICNNVQNRKIVIILGMEILRSTAEKIGEPFAVEKAGANPPQASAAPAAPRSYGSVAPSAPEAGYTPIMALNPYQNRWKIKARISSKAPIKTWSNARGEGKLFSAELVDSSGDDIRCTFFKEAVDLWYERLEKGKVYTFANGRLKIGNRKYNNCKSEYEISFGQDVQIEGPIEDSRIRSMVYKLKKISDLASLNPETAGLVDICGVVTADNGVKELTSKAGRELKKRDVTVVDASGASISVTFWGEKAMLPDAQFQNNPVVLLKGARLGDYGGRSMSTTFSTVVLFNPTDLPEAVEMAQWWSDQGQSMSFSALSETPQGTSVDRSGLEWRKTVDTIRRENMGSIADGKGGMKPTYINTKAYITFMKRERWCYPSDPQSMKKLIEPTIPGGTWRNEHEDKEYDEPCWRYIAYFQTGDYTGQQWVSAFGDKAQAVFSGVDANDLKKLETGDASQKQEFRNTFDRIQFKMMKMTLQCKTDTYNDETRTKVNVFRAEPLNFVDENKKLCEGIEKYLGVSSGSSPSP